MSQFDQILDLLLVVIQQRSHHFCVHDLSSVEKREQQPDEEEKSQSVPVRDKCQQESEIGLNGGE